eukprot:715003-Pelagomonas_calceolata.AAC.1
MKKIAMGIWRVSSSTPCLILVIRVKRSMLKSTSGACKFIGALDRMTMTLQSKLGGFMSVKTEHYGALKCGGV